MAMTLRQEKMTITWTSGLNIVAGAWILLSALMFRSDNTSTAAIVSNLIVGAVVVILAVARVTGQGFRTAWPSWVNMIAGLWLIAAPLLFNYPTVGAAFNQYVLGFIVAILAIISAVSTPERGQTA